MDRPTSAMLKRMPLAEGVMLLWRWVASPTRLQGIWDRFRGSCYQKLLKFALMVRLIADALLQHGGSGRRSFEKYAETEELPCSVQAVYKKLARLPVAVSEAFLKLAKEHAPKYCLYTLRHSWATHALAKGIDALTVAILLGHRDPSTLAKVYQHLSQSPEYLREQARRAGA